MRNRNDLTITAVSEMLTSSTDLALQIMHSREREAEEERTGRGLNIPWTTLLAGGAAIAAAIALLRESEEEITGASDAPKEGDTEGAAQAGEGSEAVIPTDEDNEESLLDKLVNWLKMMPADKEDKGTKTMPPAPAIASTNSGETMVNAEATKPKAFTAPEGVASNVSSYIMKAASAVGIDPGLLFTVAKVESNFKTSALNKITGATGLFQFIPSTWSWLIKKYPQLGFTSEDVKDPEKNAMMGAVYLKSISDTLTNALGRAVSPVEVYMGHFLGPSGAIRFLKALAENPKAIASQMFPAAAKANKNIFFDGKKPLTLAQVMGKMSGKINPAYAQYTGTGSPTTESAPAVAGDPTKGSNKVASADATYTNQSVDTKVTPIQVGSLSAIANQKVASRADTQGTDTPGSSSTPTGGGSSSAKKVQTATYFRDRNGTLVSIPT